MLNKPVLEDRFKQKGFTIIELTITMLIMGILLSYAYPSFARAQVRWNLGMAAHLLMSDLRQWEGQAMAEQKHLRFLLNQEAKTYTIRDGMKIKKSQDLSPYLVKINFTDGMNDFNLLSTGNTNRAGHFTLIGKYNEFKYVYVLNTTGRVRVADTLNNP